LAETLVEHYRHTLAVYAFVRDSLIGSPPSQRRKEALGQVRLMEACADWLELLEPHLEPLVRIALYLYLEEVTKLARVVRGEVDSIETSPEILGASVERVLRTLEACAEPRFVVDNCHSDATV
jgi:hypothetical protein